MNQMNLSAPIAFFMATITTLIYGSTRYYGFSGFTEGTYLDYALSMGFATSFNAETAITILLSFSTVFVSSFALFWLVISIIVSVYRSRQG